MLDRHALLRQDVFSFTKAGQPFLAFEYGSELLYAAAYKAAGLAGVAVLAGLVLALTYTLVARFLIRRGGDPLLAYLVSMAAAVLSAAHWLARPHLFTLLFVMLLLELLYYTGRRALLLYAALFVVWANLHGGFSFGCILMPCTPPARPSRAALDRSRPLVRPRAPCTRRPGVALLASLLNPNGYRLLAHVFGVLRQQRDPRGRPRSSCRPTSTPSTARSSCCAARGHRRARVEPAPASGPHAAGAAGNHRVRPDLAAEHRAVRADRLAPRGAAPGPGVAGAPDSSAAPRPSFSASTPGGTAGVGRPYGGGAARRAGPGRRHGGRAWP